MYEERRFSLRNTLLQILLIIIFIFILVWLFPTKDYMKDNFVTKTELQESLESIYGRNFADNIESMRSAAKDYFTNERLPKKVGESVTLTLKEMVNKKLIVPFVDSNNKACDFEDSYVTVTKQDGEYHLKVQLTCSDYSDYIIDYLGCYDYCDDCNTTKPSKNTNTTKPTTTPEKEKNYEYKYLKKIVSLNTYSNWSDWSEWSTNYKAVDNLTQVEKKTEKNIIGYNKVNQIIGYNTITKQVEDGTEQKLVDTKEPTITTTTKWVSGSDVETTNKKLTSTSTTKYTLKSEKNVSYVVATAKPTIPTTTTWVQSNDVTTTNKQLTSTSTTRYTLKSTKNNRVVVATKNPTIVAEHYTAWSDNVQKTTTYNEALADTNLIDYTLVSINKVLDECNTTCSWTTIRVYEYRTRTLVPASISCPAGYELSSDKKTCNDYETNVIRTYKVENKKVVNGAPTCDTANGYKLSEDKTTCTKYGTKVIRTYSVQNKVSEGTKTCATGYTISTDGTACNRYETVKKYKTVTEKVAIYGEVNGDPIYETVVKYRFRTRTQLTVAGVKYDYKWSSSKNDTTLINDGYVFTGEQQEV